MILSKKLRFDQLAPMGGVRWSNMLDNTRTYNSVQADSHQ